MHSPYGPKPVRQVVAIHEPASFAQDDHPALSRNLIRDLQTERGKAYEGLIAAKDWADFEKRRGVIHGIDSAIGLCQQQQEKLNA